MGTRGRVERTADDRRQWAPPGRPRAAYDDRGAPAPRRARGHAADAPRRDRSMARIVAGKIAYGLFIVVGGLTLTGLFYLVLLLAYMLLSL